MATGNAMATTFGLLGDEMDLTKELRAEIERLRAGGCARDQTTTQYCAEAARLAAENEKLRAEVARWSGPVQEQWKKEWAKLQAIYDAEAARLSAENAQLRAAVVEIDSACKNTGRWSEIVMERIIERVEEIARAALEGK